MRRHFTIGMSEGVAKGTVCSWNLGIALSPSAIALTSCAHEDSITHRVRNMLYAANSEHLPTLGQIGRLLVLCEKVLVIIVQHLRPPNAVLALSRPHNGSASGLGTDRRCACAGT